VPPPCAPHHPARAPPPAPPPPDKPGRWGRGGGGDNGNCTGRSTLEQSSRVMVGAQLSKYNQRNSESSRPKQAWIRREAAAFFITAWIAPAPLLLQQPLELEVLRRWPTARCNRLPSLSYSTEVRLRCRALAIAAARSARCSGGRMRLSSSHVKLNRSSMYIMKISRDAESGSSARDEW